MWIAKTRGPDAKGEVRRRLKAFGLHSVARRGARSPQLHI